jgi:hypothetical protein
LEFAFPAGAGATVKTYKKDEQIQKEKDECGFYVKLFGLKRRAEGCGGLAHLD